MSNLEINRSVKNNNFVDYIWKDKNYRDAMLGDYIEKVTKRARSEGDLLKEKTTNYFIEGENGRGYRLSMGFFRSSVSKENMTSKFEIMDKGNPSEMYSAYRLVFTGSPEDVRVPKDILAKAIRSGLLNNLPSSIDSVDVFYQHNSEEKDYRELDVDRYNKKEDKGIYSMF